MTCACNNRNLGAIDFDPIAMAPGWSFEKWEQLKRDLSTRFPNLGAMQAKLERDYGGKNQAWWYWKASVRTSPLMGKWWFYVLGTHLKDFQNIILGEAKHMRDLSRAVVEYTVPEAILDGILGLGPRVKVISESVSRVGDTAGDIMNAVDVAGDVANFTPVPGLGFALKAASSIARVLEKFFSGAWMRSPPDRGKGELAVRVASPVFVLEMPFGDTPETMQPTGVPSRFTRDALADGFADQSALARQSEAAGALSREQAAEAAKQATAQGVQAGQDHFVQKIPGGGFGAAMPYTPASAGFNLQAVPTWAWGAGGLTALALLFAAMRR